MMDLDIAPRAFLRGMSGVDLIDSVHVSCSSANKGEVEEEEDDDDDAEECSGRSAMRERYTSSPPTFAFDPVTAAVATTGGGAVGVATADEGFAIDAGIDLPVTFPDIGTACSPGLYMICCSFMGIGCMADIPARILSVCS